MASLGARIVTAASNMARKLGQSLDSAGAKMEVCKYKDRLVPSTRFVAVDGITPKVDPLTAFVAPNASIIGDVTLSKNSSIWYGATVRGDVHKVTIGENTSVGDRAVVHVAKIQGDFPCVIGNNVTIGPGAMVHAATLKDSVVVGPNAQVLDGATVEQNSIIAPGSVVTPGTTVDEGQFWSGSPAKMVRKVSAAELASTAEDTLETIELARIHAYETSKDLAQLVKDDEAYEDATTRDPEYWQPDPNAKEEGDVLGQGSPGLIFDSTLTNPEEGLKLKQRRKQI